MTEQENSITFKLSAIQRIEASTIPLSSGVTRQRALRK
jgi:hypothetical protein